ncbi:MFS transporter [Saccharopolyspora griseoalba]|uniref:MFS transporter n=1 Tax=Saccharopolyspora griseoalba TaxID=1431848 RepID=A0ABW2LSH5_9PSEU
MTSETGDAPPRSSNSQTRKAAASGWVGSALEYYDWFVYAQAAALIFPTVFFPAGNATVALVSSLGTYAVGYVARPIGALVFGHWGDRHGRKHVLVLAMLLMGFSTFAVALLPTYHQVGVWAPVLLVLLRFVQGFAVSGELSGASAMIAEHAPFGKRGFYVSFSLHGTQAGQVIAAAVFLPLSAVLSDEAFNSWGWRIPFLLSAVVVFAGYLIRRKVEETRTFLERTEEPSRPPVAEVLRNSGADVLRAICMTMVNVIGVVVSVFGAAYATQSGYGIGMDKSIYLWIPVVANLVALPFIPWFGALSDRFGRRPMMITGALGSGLLSIAYLWAVSQGAVLLTIVLAIFTWGVFYQISNATFAAFFQELFPARTRVTGFAIAQNVGLTLTAFLPSLFTLVAPPGSANVWLVVGGLCLGITVLAAGAAWTARETHRVPLDQLGEPDAQPLPRAEFERLRAG